MSLLLFFFSVFGDHRALHVLTHSFPTRRSSDLAAGRRWRHLLHRQLCRRVCGRCRVRQIAVEIRSADVEGASSQDGLRSEEHTSELQSLMRISYAVFCLKKKIIICKADSMQNVRYIMLNTRTTQN